MVVWRNQSKPLPGQPLFLEGLTSLLNCGTVVVWTVLLLAIGYR